MSIGEVLVLLEKIIAAIVSVLSGFLDSDKKEEAAE